MFAITIINYQLIRKFKILEKYMKYVWKVYIKKSKSCKKTL